MNDLTTYMLQMSRRLQDEYERIQSRVKEDPGTAGDNGEEDWATLFKEWLPQSYHVVTKGRIMDIEGNCSPQIDILILSPNYPKILLNKKEYLAGGVIAAFECKLTLRRKHIYQAIETAKIISNIYTPLKGVSEITPYEMLHSEIIYGIVAHSYDFDNPKSIFDSIDNAIRKGIKEANISKPRELIDLICISDLSTWGSGNVIHMKGGISDKSNSQKTDRVSSHINRFTGDFIEDGKIVKNSKTFTPIGVFLSKLFRKIAWKDVTLKNIADYFQESKLEGTGDVVYLKDFELIKAYSLLRERFAKRLIEKQKEFINKNGVLNLWSEWGVFYY